MKQFRCCLLGLVALFMPISALPTTFSHNQPYLVDMHQYSQLYSTHLIFDHLDSTLSNLSKRISQHFQNLIQVTMEPLSPKDDFVVDVDLLKGQLQGAVGSFVEDSLPSIWNTRAAVIDKNFLANHIGYVTTQYCSPHNDNYLNTCVIGHSQEIIYQVDQYIQRQLKSIVRVIVTQDLPPLFQTTQSHVNGILAHFNHYIVQNNISRSAYIVHKQFEEPNELISDLEKAVNQYHPHSSFEEFMTLAKVDQS
ncbi:uncharacterized protein B0P05DRAFT_537134 [Gilbertella persicaria]|uniref:uncharacterized protein n=1 Tax=Gilbertella persicaria TaxID=101096 RepID=UPI00221EB0FC|nr:uncharacterized protein B0P05DRAFT_537134 [Gilbertella persicaria]KAI8083397.1 hypothetical protein B0P05DRAFT_537134 [Gilbertella persicaria]